MIVKINTEGTYFLYVTDPLGDNLSDYDIRYSTNLFKHYNIAEIENVTLILDAWVSMINDHHYSYQCLYWFEAKDIKGLNDRVLNGNATDADFENSIKCEFHTHERCTHCKERWDVLAVDAALFYNGNKALGKSKIAMARERKAFLKCPACNNAFAESYVVKIFGPSTK